MAIDSKVQFHDSAKYEDHDESKNIIYMSLFFEVFMQKELNNRLFNYMPNRQFNKTYWDGDYDWSAHGEEWSAAWGGSKMQWYGSILPRIHSHVPSGRILEIASGYGRWTTFLKNLCGELILVELSEECLEASKQRFRGERHITFHLNDGRSLDMIADKSVDFIFSFDSLVHADLPTLKAYLSQFPRILSNNGVAFLHHSNLGEYEATYSAIRKVPQLWPLLKRMGLVEKTLHKRDPGVRASDVKKLIEEQGMTCTSQEIVHWGTKRTYLDCFTTLSRNSSGNPITGSHHRNPNFMSEAEHLRQIAHLYTDR
ncbi:MAG: class I SAM-dependent methyltransferase [Hyphomicrobiales bacterium]